MDSYNSQKSNGMPYKGLMPYSESEKDASSFFGREAQQETIKRNLKNLRLTLLFGESGVGKSSILRAGVVHSLREEAKRNLAESGTPKFAVAIFPPLEGNRSWQDEPLTEVLKQVEEDIQKSGVTVQAAEPGLSFAENLLVWTRRIGGKGLIGEIFIIFDQFEEYFLYHPEEDGKSKFALEFSRAVNRPNLRVNFLIAIRQDSFANLNRLKCHIPNLFDNLLHLEHLDKISAYKAIENPVTEYYNHHVPPDQSITIETTLVEEILKQISQSQDDWRSGNGRGGTDKHKNSSEAKIEAPYLQLVMTRLWDEEMKAGSRSLQKEKLLELGGVTRISKEHLDKAMDALSESEKDISARIFQYLVTPSGTKYAYSIPDLAAQSEGCDPTEIANLLEKLASGKQRIVRPVAAAPNQPPESKRYEIFHDVLTQPILDWRRQYRHEQDLKKNRQFQQQKLEEERQQRVRTIQQGLPAQSLRQQRHRQDELAALLARQAYLFNRQDHTKAIAQVDDALRKALSAPYFRNILQFPYAISSVVLSPDGKTVAASSQGGTISLWNRFYVPDFRLLESHEEEVYTISFSPDGQMLASGGSNNIVKLWNLHQPNPEPVILSGHEGSIQTVAFSPNGHVLASGSQDKTIRLWNWRQPGAVPVILTGHEGMVGAIAFSPDSQLLVSGSNDGTVRVWDLQEPNAKPTVCYSHTKAVLAVAFSPDGHTLASGSDDRTIRLWDLQDPDAVPTVFPGHKETVRTAAFSPDGQILASAGDDQIIKLWDIRDLDQAPQVLKGHYFRILSIAFSPDSQVLVSGSQDNTVRIWDLRPPMATPKVLNGHTDDIMAVAFSPNGQMLASGSKDETVRLWNLSQLDTSPQVFQHEGEVFAVTFFFSKDNQIQWLASGSTDCKVRLWDLRQPDTPPKVLIAHKDGVSSIAFSPDGQKLASGSWDNTIQLWDLRHLEASPITLNRHTKSVTSVTFSPDGKTLASCSDDCTIILWNLQNLDADPTVLRDHNGRVWSITFSPDGQKLASASDDWTVRLWDLSQPQPTYAVLGKHNTWVSSVVFSPDGEMLASSSFDRSIKLWNLKHLDELPIVLEGHDQSVTSVAFSPDGKLLASGSHDNTVRLWIARTEELAEMVSQRVLRNLTMEEWKQFMGDDIPYEQTCPNLPPSEEAPTDVH